MNYFRLTLAAILLMLAGCKSKTDANWTQHLKQFQEDYFAHNPPNAVGQGRHEYDGQLPDWSAAGLKKHADWLNEVRAKTLKFSEVNPAQRFEREYLLTRIDTELFWLQDAESPWRNPAYYTGSLDPSTYLTRPYAAAGVRLKAFIKYLKAVPAAASAIRANLRTPLPKTYVSYGQKAFAGYAEFFRGDAGKAFADVKDTALQAELKAAIEPAAAAMQSLAEWLKSEASKATDAYALGADKFAQMLQKTERVGTKLAELEAIGQADLARNLAALKKACDEYLPNKSIEACMAKMAADKPAGGPVEGARAQLADLRQFLVDQKLVSIPGTELALVNEAPAFNRANFAYIDIPGPFEKGMPSVYYIAPPDPTWSKADQEAYLPGKADLLGTSVHEVWPGHFLQFLHANRSPSPFGQIFVGYAFAEGWAHYSEELMIEAGLAKGAPEIHIGQLANALLRNVRFICAIGLHTQGMSVETCEKMFKEKAYQDPGNARQQAARGTYDPAYLNYTMGKLMIYKLRADWTAKNGGRDAWQQFHDKFLSYGGPPIPLVREQMLGAVEGSLF